MRKKNYFDEKTGTLHLISSDENDKRVETTFRRINAIVVLHNRIARRTARIKALKEMNAPKIILDNEKRMLKDFRDLYQEVLEYEIKCIGCERLIDAIFDSEED